MFSMNDNITECNWYINFILDHFAIFWKLTIALKIKSGKCTSKNNKMLNSSGIV